MSFTYDIKANTAKNRLYLRLVGTMTVEDAKKVADTIIVEIRKLKPGWAVVNDISELKPADDQAVAHLKRAQDASGKAGCKRVVRVMGKQAITHMQWNRTLSETQGIRADVASTVEEADKLLDAG
ncbi:MAG: hypothetical protein JO292_00210 [Betaproteobacteria bacterium]|nr:hypothetical protein [Betaproteobacteria bacterium]